MGAMADPDSAPTSARSGLDGMFSTLRGFGVHRNTDDRWLAGVCSGIADRLGIDPLIVRGALIVLLFVGGIGGLAYLVAWALLPDQNGKILAEAALHGDGWGIALLIVIGIALVSNISDRWWLWTILCRSASWSGGRIRSARPARRRSRWATSPRVRRQCRCDVLAPAGDRPRRRGPAATVAPPADSALGFPAAPTHRPPPPRRRTGWARAAPARSPRPPAWCTATDPAAACSACS